MNGHIYLYTPNMVNFNLPFLSRLLPFFSYEYYIYNTRTDMIGASIQTEMHP